MLGRRARSSKKICSIYKLLAFLEENWREKFQLKLAFTNHSVFRYLDILMYYYFFIFSTHELPQENSMP